MSAVEDENRAAAEAEMRRALELLERHGFDVAAAGTVNLHSQIAFVVRVKAKSFREVSPHAGLTSEAKE